MAHEPEADVTSSSSEDEESESEQLDANFLAALAKIKQRDASIYDDSAKLFQEEVSAEEESGSDGDTGGSGDGAAVPKASRKKADPKFLRQVLAEQALEGGLDSDSDAAPAAWPRTYNQEQQDVKTAFLQAAGDIEDDLEDGGDFGRVLKRPPSKPAGGAEQSDPVIKELLVKCFGQGEAAADPEEAFLRDFVQGQQWRDDDDAPEVAPPRLLESDPTGDLDGDLQHTEQADRFEASFNFRFEEPGAEHAVTHPRNVEGTVRKKDERRKLARERKAKRKEEELRRQQEEAKRARKAARAERQTQLARVQEAAGQAGPDEARLKALMDADDWDPAAYDAAMASAFGEDYYDVAEAFAGAEDAGEDAAPADAASGAVQTAEREQPAFASKVTGNASTLDDEEAGEVDVAAAAPPGGRFKYRPVPKQDYGLDILDILGLDPKELNQVVGLKRLAPYREERGLQYSNTAKLQELRQAKAQRPTRGPKAGRDARLEPRRPGKPGKPAAPPGSAANDFAARKPVPEAQVEGQQAAAEPAAYRAAMAAALDAGAQPAAEDRDSRKASKEKEQRLKSYGKLALRPEGQGKGAKRKAAPEAEAASPGLSKGERKRLKRSEKRVQKRAAGEV